MTNDEIIALGQKHEKIRCNHPYMEYYRHVFADSKRWNGVDSLRDKTVLVYMEQGFGDCIQFFRYIPTLKKRGCTVKIYCREELRRLFVLSEPTIDFYDKNDPLLPEHDYHVMSMSLICYLAPDLCMFDSSHCNLPYLKTDVQDLHPLWPEITEDKNFKIGICWEGSSTNTNSRNKEIPLIYFKELGDRLRKANKKVSFYSLQPRMHNATLLQDCEEMELFGVELNDFLDTALLIRRMDSVVSTDTAVAHLAGAINKSVYLMLGPNNDGRYGEEDKRTNWYRSMMIFHKKDPTWDGAFSQLLNELSKKI